MEPSELLRYAVTRVEGLGLRYLITGSVASTYYGEPRFTNDIDIVLDLPMSRVQELCRGFPTGQFYISEEAVRQAVQQRTQFNVIHPGSGLKIDFMVADTSPFNRSRFARARRVVAAEDFAALFSSPEDVVLKKMESYREGGSEKHIRDILGILAISGDALDLEYISEWTGRLDLESVWKEIQQRRKQ